MRKITALAVEAFEAGKPFRRSNTAVLVARAKVTMVLFDNAIARRIGGKLYVRTAGYPTMTTRERLNGLDGVSVYTRKKALFLNGSPWISHENWTEVK
jgi:hypothetical protein